MLSMKCPSCGGTIHFDENHIATFCSLCGAHLPDMTDYVKKASNLTIEQKQHSMNMETMDKEIQREQNITRQVNTRNIVNLITKLPFILLAFFFFYMLFKMMSM